MYAVTRGSRSLEVGLCMCVCGSVVADGSKSLRVGLCMYVHICAGIYLCIRNVLAVGEESLGIGLCVLYSPTIWSALLVSLITQI